MFRKIRKSGGMDVFPADAPYREALNLRNESPPAER